MPPVPSLITKINTRGELNVDIEIVKNRLAVAEQIEARPLQEKVFECWELAIQRSKFSVEEILNLPFTLLLEDCSATLLDHTVAVVRIAISAAEIMISETIPSYELDMDYLVAGGLLHDVGKVLEYEMLDGRLVKSDYGRLVRHPFSGAALANELGLPPTIINIIATHSHEGARNFRCNEAIIINHADFIYFENFKNLSMGA